MDSYRLLVNEDQVRPELSWTITNLQRLPQEGVNSEAFGWVGYDVKAIAHFRVKEDGFAYVSLSLGPIGGVVEPLAIIPTVYYVLKDVNGDQHLVRPATYLFTSTFSFTGLFFEAQLVEQERLFDPRFNRGDSVVVEVFVEPPRVANDPWSRSGNLNFCLARYGERKCAEERGLVGYHESPYFHTSCKGYRVRVIFHFDGRGPQGGKGLSVNVCFLQGPFDQRLTGNFRHRTTVTLLNRKCPKLNVSRTVERNLVDGWAYPVDVCSWEEVEEVIEDDVLYYNVKIKAYRKRPRALD